MRLIASFFRDARAAARRVDTRSPPDNLHGLIENDERVPRGRHPNDRTDIMT